MGGAMAAFCALDLIVSDLIACKHVFILRELLFCILLEDFCTGQYFWTVHWLFVDAHLHIFDSSLHMYGKDEWNSKFYFHRLCQIFISVFCFFSVCEMLCWGMGLIRTFRRRGGWMLSPFVCLSPRLYHLSGKMGTWLFLSCLPLSRFPCLRPLTKWESLEVVGFFLFSLQSEGLFREKGFVSLGS